MVHQNGLPVGTNRPVLTREEVENAKVNNQFVVAGTNPEFFGDDLIVFLEFVGGAGTISLNDKDDVLVTAVGSVVGTVDLAAAPIRFDGGVKAVGTDIVIKGFYITKKIN